MEPRISKNEVRDKLGKPGVVVIDVRHDQRTATEKIAGAKLEDYEKVEQWLNKYPKDGEIILYCS